MKTLGLIGGMSWESTATYYQNLNQLVRQRLGGLHSAQILLWSFDFATIESLQAQGDWQTATHHMITAAQTLERAGADAVLICTNTMHKMADAVADACQIPVLHIADATGAALKKNGHQKPLLLATAYTMEQTFYTGRLTEHFGLDVRVPNPADRQIVHDIIYTELCRGIITPKSRTAYTVIMKKATDAGADSVIFGCTEIGLLVTQEDTSLPVYDTTALHADAAVAFALEP